MKSDPLARTVQTSVAEEAVAVNRRMSTTDRGNLLKARVADAIAGRPVPFSLASREGALLALAIRGLTDVTSQDERRLWLQEIGIAALVAILSRLQAGD